MVIFHYSFRTKASTQNQTGHRFRVAGIFGHSPFSPPGHLFLSVMSHRLLPRHVHMGAQRPRQPLSANAVQLPAPHPCHNARALQHLQVCFPREGLQESVKNLRAEGAAGATKKERS